MSILLQPDEQVIYPQPYLPGEPAELMVTSKRLIRVTDAGVAEFPANKIDYVGRDQRRPLFMLGLILSVVSLAMLVVGIEELVMTPGLIGKIRGGASQLSTMKPPIPIPGAPPVPAVPAAAAGAVKEAKAEAKDAVGDDPAGGDEESDEGGEDGSWFGFGPLGGGLLAGGGVLILIAGICLMRIKRYYVTCRIGNRMLELPAKGKSEQTMMLATISSASTVAKTLQPPAPAEAAAPPVQVDDGGDPVKALQELKAAKDAGKVDAATFDAKRAVLLERLAKRG